MLHAEQLTAFDVVLNDPLAHAVHAWSLVAVPTDAIALPGAQLVQLTHAVAALPS